ncbi:C-X-C motif chemokine 11 [Macrotis lagotis]|uniref:C-X-C motif chemokine 11 n=1 Tax=Macrotis lagotis TaxID=92651 RepID=UPI003D68024C
MRKKVLAILLATLLCSTVVHGFPMFQGSRCLCRGSTMNSVNPKYIKNVLLFLPSGNCDKKEIIITLKGGTKMCLNPISRQGKLILKVNHKDIVLHFLCLFFCQIFKVTSILWREG